MKTFAAIDVGSYELSMKIFEISSRNGIREIDHIRQRIDLGTDTFATGKISYERVDELCRTLREYGDIMKGYRVDDYKAYGTSAIRETENTMIVLDQIAQRTGIRIEVLSNSEQRFLDYKSIASKGEAFNRIIEKGTAIVDIGGGTTDVAVISLGGTELRICQVPGHTPGSIVILETRENYLFTGDAIGSGCGVWMQIPGSTDLKTYYDSLIHLMHWLVDNGGRMKFFGGHHMQAFESVAHPVYNPLGLGVLADMIDLVGQVLSGEIQGRPSNVSRVFTQEPLLYASYGRAEMQYLLSQK